MTMTTIEMEMGSDGVFRSAPGGGSGGGGGTTGGPSSDPYSGASDGLEIASHYNRKVWAILFGLGLGSLLFLSLMLYINMHGGEGFILFVMMITSMYWVATALSPAPLGIAAILGFVQASLNNTDRSQGILRGIEVLFEKVMLGGLLVIQVSLGILSTWSFAENWMAFYYLLAGSILLLVVFHVFELGGGRYFAWGVAIYTAIVMIIALWTTIPDGTFRLWNPFGQITSKSTGAVPPASGRSEVAWSEVIKVNPWKKSNELWSPGTKKCFDIILLSGVPNTTEAFQQHSIILPWKSRGDPSDWVPNNGGEFRGIKLVAGNTPLTFRYRFLPNPCS